MRATVAAVVAALMLGVPAPQAAARTVAVRDNVFSPRGVTVTKGGALTWAWRGRRRHNVLFYSGPVAGRPRRCATRRTGTCTRRFRRRGRYEYVCTLHGSMTGAVRVR